MERRALRGGSIAGFITVGIVIVLIFIGAFYYLRGYGEQARSEQTIAQNEEQNSEDEIVIDEGDKESNGVVPGTTQETQESQEEDSTDALPETGIGSTLSQLIGICLLTISSTHFILSKAKLNQHL